MNPSHLAIPAVCLLISFLSYTPQILFQDIVPGPLSTAQSIKFNILVLCIWICYFRACFTDPGAVPKGFGVEVEDEGGGEEEVKREGGDDVKGVSSDGRERSDKGRGRWCRKCGGYKAPRSHHCKVCGR